MAQIEKTLRDCNDNEVIAELRDRMKKQGRVVKVLSFDEPTATVDELIAELRREHGVESRSWAEGRQRVPDLRRKQPRRKSAHAAKLLDAEQQPREGARAIGGAPNAPGRTLATRWFRVVPATRPPG